MRKIYDSTARQTQFIIDIPPDGGLRSLRSAKNDAKLLIEALNIAQGEITERIFARDIDSYDKSATGSSRQELAQALQRDAELDSLIDYRKLKIANRAIGMLDSLKAYLDRDAATDRRKSGDERVTLDPELNMQLNRLELTASLSPEETELAIRGMQLLATKKVDLVIGDKADVQRVDGYYPAELVSLKRAARDQLSRL